jgi:hypothetical protein
MAQRGLSRHKQTNNNYNRKKREREEEVEGADYQYGGGSHGCAVSSKCALVKTSANAT